MVQQLRPGEATTEQQRGKARPPLGHHLYLLTAGENAFASTSLRTNCTYVDVSILMMIKALRPCSHTAAAASGLLAPIPCRHGVAQMAGVAGGPDGDDVFEVRLRTSTEAESAN